VPRRKKHHLPDEVYDGGRYVLYLTICTANRGRWLMEPDLATIARDEILNLHVDFPVLGYCIMPDHVHIMMCNAGSQLGSVLNRFKGRTSRQIRMANPGLEVWQEGYWDHIVRREEGLYTVLQYILLNPVRAGLVEYWWDYEWLGAPLFGEVGPQFFSLAAPENTVWRDLLAVE
jgi:REP element-mobilizing transposase RayT